MSPARPVHPSDASSPAPMMLGYATPPSAGGVDLRAVALRQRYVMTSILAYIIVSISLAALPPELEWLCGALTVAAIIAGAVAVFALAIAVHGPGVGTLLGVITLVPVLGVIVLLIINGQATRLLRRHGIRVGMLGAKVSQIPSPGNSPPT